MTGFDIVIPNWNGKRMLEICLPSIYSQKFNDFSVTVVDNGSTDDSLAFLNSSFPQVMVIALPENMGFSSAVNRGIQAGNREWVLLLNNDIEMDSGCLENLAAEAGREPAIGIFALKMLSYSDRTLIDGAGDGVLRGGVGYRLGTMEPDSATYNLKREVFGACAGAALYRRSLFDQIGLFDEDFFAYLEDVDLNLRAVRAGYTCCYIPEAIVYHMGSATSGSKINEFTVRLTTRNNIYVIGKNFSFTMVLRFLPAILIYQFFWLLFVIKKRQFVAYMQGLAKSFSGLFLMVRKGSQRNSTDLPVSDYCRKIIESEREVVRSIMSRRSGEGKNNFLLRWYLAIFC